MTRKLFAGSFIALVGVGAASIASCSSETNGTGTPGTTSTSTGMGGSGGEGGGEGGMGGAGGGAGGMGGAGGGAGGMGGGGGGGGGGVGGVGGVGGIGGAGGMAKPDQDSDGWTPADGDCCDVPSGDCEDPELVNPGAFEYLGNMVDDDCDPSTLDNVIPNPCSTQPLSVPTSSTELVQAMDICNFTTANPALPDRIWGVISANIVLADGSSNLIPKDVQLGVLANYGMNVAPKKGNTMAALSTGTARDENDPQHTYPQNGNMAGQVGNFDGNTSVNAPPTWLAQHGGKLPSPAACPECTGQECGKAYDSVNLKLKIRVPTNAKSFSYNFKFYSAEFPEFVCQSYNDFFVTLLSSSYQKCPAPVMGDPCIPVDTNIAFDALNNPVSVNNAFLEVCFPPPGAPAGACPGGTLELLGTGMGGWNGNVKDGGGTVWLVNDAPVTPGEDMTIEFIVFDAGDHNVDSIVLLDNFRWKINPSATGVHK
jgi:hypothetical protein